MANYYEVLGIKEDSTLEEIDNSLKLLTPFVRKYAGRTLTDQERASYRDELIRLYAKIHEKAPEDELARKVARSMKEVFSSTNFPYYSTQEGVTASLDNIVHAGLEIKPTMEKLYKEQEERERVVEEVERAKPPVVKEKFKDELYRDLKIFSLVGIMAIVGAYSLHNYDNAGIIKEPTAIEQPLNEDRKEDYCYLTRVYTVGEHESTNLEMFANDSGMGMEALLAFNGLEPNAQLLPGMQIRMQYRAKVSDLDYYKGEITPKQTSYTREDLEELATRYQTDVDTFVFLNDGYLEDHNGTYIVTGDKIVRPSFVNEDMIKVLKSVERATPKER